MVCMYVCIHKCAKSTILPFLPSLATLFLFIIYIRTYVANYVE